MNRMILITGGTSGYGLASAKKFKEAGDTVIITARHEKKVADTVEENGFSAGFPMDVTRYADWVALRDFLMARYGRVDVLVNNAGGGVRIADTTAQTQEEIDAAIALNLNSVIYASSLLGEQMKQQKSGIIINIASVCARHAWGGWSVYAAAKAGVLQFTKGLYVELRPYGVRATCLIPAAASTGFQKAAGIGEEHQSLAPEDIADAVLFAANQPSGTVVEEMTVWGTTQEVCPL